MEPNRLLYLSQEDVVSVGLTMAEIIEVLDVAFREKGRGNTEMPPKPGIHPGGEDNFIHAMPAYIPALNAAGVKWVSGFPGNQKKGLPYITGLLILNDPETMIFGQLDESLPLLQAGRHAQGILKVSNRIQQCRGTFPDRRFQCLYVHAI